MYGPASWELTPTAEAPGTWLLTGVLERHPHLKLVFVEAGVGWVAWWSAGPTRPACGASEPSADALAGTESARLTVPGPTRTLPIVSVGWRQYGGCVW
jgi:hypothetical protein